MRARFLSVAGVIVGAAVLAATTAPAAQAAPAHYKPPGVAFVAPYVLASTSLGQATVYASYRCFGGDAGTHLFIAVKQGPQVNATTHTSSAYAKTFYSTNYNSDGPGLSLTCDGIPHFAAFVLEPDPYWAQAGNNPPPLKFGPAFVQFCVFDSTNTGDNDPNGFAFNYSMKTVVAFP
jgi:hypothetical protein